METSFFRFVYRSLYDKGDPGIQGPVGPVGPKGPPGEPGKDANLSTLQLISNVSNGNIVQISGSDIKSTATCSDDQILAGGGYNVTEGFGNVLENALKETHGWLGRQALFRNKQRFITGICCMS